MTDLAFTDDLPYGIMLAAPAFVSNSCGGTLTAPDGGDTITLVDGSVGAGLSCQIVVNVTGPTPSQGPLYQHLRRSDVECGQQRHRH